MGQDYNGHAVNLALILGELRADTRHNTESIRQQTAILLDIKDAIEDIPSRLSTVIATEKHPSKDTVSILKAIPPILKACVPILTILGLMTGQIAWTDIPKLLGH